MLALPPRQTSNLPVWPHQRTGGEVAAWIWIFLISVTYQRGGVLPTLNALGGNSRGRICAISASDCFNADYFPRSRSAEAAEDSESYSGVYFQKYEWRIAAGIRSITISIAIKIIDKDTGPIAEMKRKIKKIYIQIRRRWIMCKKIYKQTRNTTFIR